ncbi:MAG: 50S ribosomal protein L10 [Candidatus Absconditabacteria bacterium]|nr:50S ribosomal protein L10 [Candidatus Absconditabacteria bacterium]MDD3868190.1 50S ribosomal protein L10 [Candidatus Absconditabacteria bacterium]MDD4714577.1 50S ribosomal protein L10 [Candidatus Absconditabacteria bacterium]
MAISRDKKQELIKQYVEDLKAANNVVIVQQSGISVNTATAVRKGVLGTDGKYNVVRKRLFLRALEEAGYETIAHEQLEGPIVVLYAHSDEYGPLKLINKFAKEFVKAKEKSQFKFLGAWYDKKWHDGEYVTDLANIPSKEELLSKLAYLFNYPLQSFAGTLDQIAKKQEA